MKKGLLLLLFELIWATGLSQHLSLNIGDPFQRTDLDVRWNVVSNELPSKVWVYHLLPKNFSPALVSNLLAVGGFNGSDLVRSNADEILFRKADSSSLYISSHLGSIELQVLRNYGPTNLAKNVPKISEMPQLVSNFVEQAGISLDDIEKLADGSPGFNFSEPFTVYFVNHSFITNTAFRAVSFRRMVGGSRFVGAGAGGDGYVQFGERGLPTQVHLSWRNLERYREFSTASPRTIMNCIKQGKARQGMIRMDAEPIDWKTVKSLTIKVAKVSYYAGGPFDPSDWLMPFAALWTTVDRGHGTIDVEIDCPIIDETKH